MAARLLRPMRRSYSMRDTTAAMERLAASDGLSLPEQNPFAQLFDGLTYVVGTGWWLLTTCVLVAYLCFGIVPWWIVAIGAAECYTSGRRYLFPLQDNRNVQTSAMLAAAALSREASKCSIRRFISFRFHAKAPVEQVVASFKALSAHPEVREFECGSNLAAAELAHGHTHAFLICFDDVTARDAFLASASHQAFQEMAKTHVTDSYVFEYCPTSL